MEERHPRGDFFLQHGIDEAVVKIHALLIQLAVAIGKNRGQASERR